MLAVAIIDKEGTADGHVPTLLYATVPLFIGSVLRCRGKRKSYHVYVLEGWGYGAQDAGGARERLQWLRLHHGPAPVVKDVRLLEPPPKGEGAHMNMTKVEKRGDAYGHTARNHLYGGCRGVSIVLSCRECRPRRACSASTDCRIS